MSKRPKFARIWLEIEDELFPRLAFDTIERVLYYFLLARTRLRGERTVRLSIHQIGRATQLSGYLIATRVKQLKAKGCLRVHDRTKLGTTWEVIFPREVLGPAERGKRPSRLDLDSLDCSNDPRARKAIFRRERGRCFYCFREISGLAAVLDHVVPRSRGGAHGYRNVVACCQECNSLKGAGRAADFLRTLFRTGRLNSAELQLRLAALARLSRGQLRISLAT